MELGTLWFGADIDLTKLQQKIASGNQSILDALKMNYDPQSYNQMVSKLKAQLATETFEIKLTANTNRIVQNIKDSTKIGNISFGEIDKLSDKILRQAALVNDLKAKVAELNAEYNKLGGTARYNRVQDARAEYAREKAALDTLVATRKEYNQATAQAAKSKREASKAAKELEGTSLRLNTTLAGGIHISTQLGSAMSSLFAVHAARQFLDNVIEIGGQLEKQRISMGAIVGDTARANELFENIKNLAIKSPFGVVELDQYSKQLAAYGIEQSDLFNMTKRLADISAGAGQDISRLALALGHVKSATYLTGITLRQFSMNNIPMLKMLADYYSEVEKRAVSTAEVQKRISKRQVSYEDVIEQIKRMTDEGGQFYNMQEKISESLAAKFKNLRDSFDIMYGEIAESGIGSALKVFAESATSISREWKKALTVIAEAALIFGTYKTAMFAISYAQQNFNRSTIATALSQGKLSAAMLDRLVQSEQITKAQLLQAVATKKLSAADAELAAAEFNVSRAQLNRIASTGKYLNLLAAGSIATSRFTVSQLRMMAALDVGKLNWFNKGLTGLRLGLSVVGTYAKSATTAVLGFLKPLAAFAVVSAVIDTFLEDSRKAEEAEQRVLDMAEKANEGYKNMVETRNKFKVGASADMTEDSIINAIPEMVEQLKNYSKTANDTFNNAFAVNEEGKAIHSLQEQYEILAKGIDDTTEAYRKFNEIRPMIEQSIEAATPKKSWLDKFMLGTVGKLIPDKDLTVYMDLKESLEFYAKALNEANKAEQVFLRNHLDIVSAMQQMGVEGAVNMTNEQILDKLTEWLETAPSKFQEFNSLLKGDTADSFDVLISKWNTLGTATYTAEDRMKKAGKDFYQSAKVFWGEDMQQWPSNWKDVVLLAMNEATKGVKGFEDMSEDAQNDLKNIWLTPFKIKADTQEAQQQVNNLLVELQNLVGQDWTVQIGVKGVSVLDDLKAANKSYQEAIDGLDTLYASKRKLEQQNETGSEAYKKILSDEQKLIAQRDAASSIINQYGGDLPKSKKDKANSKKKVDEQLKRWKEEFTELKAFYTEYIKWAKVVGSEKALETLRKTGLWGQFFKADGSTLYDMKSWENAITQFEKKISGGTTERDKLKFEVGKEKLTPMFDQAKEIADALLKQLDEELKKQGKQWNLYKKVLDATGNKSQAATIAFGSAIRFDNFAEQLREEISNALKGTKAEGVSIDELLGMDEKKLKSDYGLLDGVIKLLNELKDVEQQLKEEDVEIFLNALKNAKSLDTELAQIKTKYDKVRAAVKDNPDLVENANKNQRSEEAKAQWEWFKKNNEDWGRIFSNLDNISSNTLQSMLAKLKEQIPVVEDNVEAVKALYEAIDKLQDKLAERNPFSSLGESLSRISTLRSLLKGYSLSDSNKKVALSKETRNKIGINSKEVSVGELFDKLRESENRFISSVGAIGTAFKSLQDVMQPVIDLFDYLGDENLSKFFSIGSDALGSAANAANGLNTIKGLFKDDSSIAKFLGGSSPYAAAAAAGLSIISSLFAMHDAALQKEIEASEHRQKLLENLTKNIEKLLERTLGGVYNTEATSEMRDQLHREIAYDQKAAKAALDGLRASSQMFAGGLLNDMAITAEKYQKRLEEINRTVFKDYISEETKKAVLEAEKTGTYYDTVFASMLAQRDELQHQMELEEDKKKSDSNAIDDYKQQIKEMEDEIKHFAEDMAKSLYDIDVKSWAAELGDALFEAWQKGESGAEAFKKKASEIMAEVAKKIAVTKLIETAMQPVLDTIVKEMENKKGMLDEQSVEKIAGQMAEVSTTLPESFNALMDALNEGMKKAGLTDMKELANETKSATQNGIGKEITEQDTTLWASYLNAIRLDVSVIRATEALHLPVISTDVHRVSVLAETQVAHLQQIAENTKRNADAADKIYDAMHRIETGATKLVIK
jgi:hypothetical protein